MRRFLFGELKPTELHATHWSRLQHFPLERAYLCEDCKSVGNSAKACPACASEAVLCLAGALSERECSRVYVASNRERSNSESALAV